MNYRYLPDKERSAIIKLLAMTLLTQPSRGQKSASV